MRYLSNPLSCRELEVPDQFRVVIAITIQG
jgi:hypothetical protein